MHPLNAFYRDPETSMLATKTRSLNWRGPDSDEDPAAAQP